MYVKILAYKQVEDITYLKLEGNLKHIFEKYGVSTGELRLDDTRRITAEQRKKLYATIKDIADYTGDVPEYIKEYLKFSFAADTGQEHFSLSDCSVTTAKEFINYVIEFVIQHGIPLKHLAIDRTDDIGRYLYYCLKYKKCCICGRQGELHHTDAIGMGNDRRTYDDSQNEKMCLCRVHHSEAHTIGKKSFCEKYKVFGVIFNE